MNPMPLERECGIFARHLVGIEPGDYVVLKYVEAHRTSPRLARGNALDQVLLRFASISPFLVRFPDAYARWFMPQAVLRKKLVLLLAILETSAPSYRTVDAVPQSNRFALFARLAGVAAMGVVSLAVGIALFGPFAMILEPETRETT